jgi:hypothetical protein
MRSQKYATITSERNTPNKPQPPYSPGQQIGTFTIQAISDNEVVLGENDKHLDFRTSLLIRRSINSEIVISTVVRTHNNTFGKLYFFIVKPIHRIISALTVNRMVNNIDKRLLPQYKDPSI